MFKEGTTLQKGYKTLLWVILANVVMAVLSYITNNKELFNPQWVGLANVILVLGKNYFDPKVRNM